MDGNWQRHSALDKYKAPREDFKVHGESWVDGARELGCYRATIGVPIGSKQMARQAQGTKQHGAHIYISLTGTRLQKVSYPAFLQVPAGYMEFPSDSFFFQHHQNHQNPHIN